MTRCRWCGEPVQRPDLTPFSDIHGACYIEEGRDWQMPYDPAGDPPEDQWDPRRRDWRTAFEDDPDEPLTVVPTTGVQDE